MNNPPSAPRGNPSSNIPSVIAWIFFLAVAAAVVSYWVKNKPWMGAEPAILNFTVFCSVGVIAVAIIGIMATAKDK